MKKIKESLYPDLKLSLISAIDEFEAIIDYADRLACTHDEDFIEALEHAIKEEQEHAAAFVAEAAEYMPYFCKALRRELAKQAIEKKIAKGGTITVEPQKEDPEESEDEPVFNDDID
jgi:hypothetical protein